MAFRYNKGRLYYSRSGAKVNSLRKRLGLTPFSVKYKGDPDIVHSRRYK